MIKSDEEQIYQQNYLLNSFHHHFHRIFLCPTFQSMLKIVNLVCVVLILPTPYVLTYKRFIQAMKGKLLSADALNQIKERLIQDQNKLRSFSNQSYLEYQFYNTDHLHREFIQNLISLSISELVVTNILDHLVQNHGKYYSCLLGYGKQIYDVISLGSLFTFSHKKHISESAFLAFFLAKQLNRKVHLVAADESLLHISHMIAGEGEQDKISFTRSALLKEGVELLNICEWQRGGITLPAEAVIVVDVFGLSPTDYAPFLLKNYASISKASKAFIYHSHLQNEEVAELLNKVSAEAFPIQLWTDHPLESISQSDQKKLIDKLIEFLCEDLNHPEKQDVVIFFPVEQHVKRFSAKLSELFSKSGLKQHVTIFTKPHQRQVRFKNSIFIVEGTSQLLNWNYDYSNVLYVIDYGKQIKFTYDYSHDCFVRAIRNSSNLEKSKRMSLVGVSRIGRYASSNSRITRVNSYLDETKELSIYLLKMIDYDLFSYVDVKHPRVAQCIELLSSLKIIEKNGGGYKIPDERIIQAAKQGVSALQSNLIYKIIDDATYNDQSRKRFANLMIMALIVTHNENNLRQAKQEVEAAAHIKPNGIWRKTGYIDSCLEIITKCELIDQRKVNQNSKSESFRRKTSKFNECEYQVFGSLFEQQEKKKKTFEEMQIPDLIREYAVNDDLINIFREQIDDYRDIFEVDPTSIIFDKHDIIKVVQLYLSTHKNAIAVYSGSRRDGYHLSNNDKNGIFPDKTSLISQLNERPEFIAVFRLSEYGNGKEILMGNSFHADTFLEVFGHLPTKKTESLSEVELEFHGITSSIFEKLWKNNGIQIVKFENENDCFVEPNEEMALIVIHCVKDKVEEIKGKFEAVLAKIRSKLSVSSKLVHYLGTTNLILGAGGAVKEIVKSDYINKCLLGNLHLEVTKEDLEELFEEFVPVKEIVINEPETGKFYKSAVIYFNSQRDYYKFYDCFQECIYYDRMMDIKPLKDEMTNVVKSQNYIQFKWYVWKSHKKALIKFADVAGAVKAVEAFKINPELDGVKVVIVYEEGSCNLIIDQLSPTTDEIYIEDALKNYGTIKDVQILKTPLKEISGEDSFLEKLIKSVFENANNANQQFKIGPIDKKKNGLRICRVNIPNIDAMNQVANQLNKTIGKLGEGRLYAQTWFEMPILVPHGSMTIYQELLDELIKEDNPNIQHFIAQDRKKTYIVLKSRIKQTLDLVHQKYANSLLGFPLFLSDYEKSVILTDIGIANIMDIEQKYHCKLIVNIQAKVLSILVPASRIKNIKEEVRARVDDNFFYRVSLNSKAFKFFKTNPEKLKEIKSNYNLTMIDLEIDSKALLLQSSALNVQKAFNYLMHFIESLTVPQQEMINADVCGICCEQPHRPYRLQNCSHKFCRDCLLQYVNSALGDASLFPLKCPHCFKEIVIDDLEILLDHNHWAKIQTIATNQFVVGKSDIMTFCFNPGCKQINMIKADSIECDVCLSTFCINCKLRYHPGLTCEEAKVGGDEIFKKYMKDNGIRQCPNKACKIPVDRVDGCYRVTCSRCNISMCFKCEPDKMIAYPDYNQCYQHLNDVHGGYW